MPGVVSCRHLILESDTDGMAALLLTDKKGRTIVRVGRADKLGKRMRITEVTPRK